MENLLAMRRAREIPSASLHEPGTSLRLGRRFLTLNPTLNLNRRAERKSKIKTKSKSKTKPRFMVPVHGSKAEASFHGPQCAAGILPADQSEQSTAGKMPAAPWPRRLTSWR